MKRSNTPNSSNKGNNNNRPSHYSSYQQGTYYAAEQTKTLEDSHKAFHEADQTAAAVLQQMTNQRSQLKDAHENVWDMRIATEQAKRELQELQVKYRQKKHRLYTMIGILAFTDIVLFLRLVHCHGNFYCL
jgi:chromosome segregation ATPase